MKYQSLSVLIISLVLNCSINNQELAGTSEQGNARISATLSHADGTPAAGAVVRLRPSNYTAQSFHPKKPLPEAIINDHYTDINGNVKFESFSLDTGSYTLEVNDNIREAILFKFPVSSSDQSIELGNNSLKPYTSVNGKIQLSAGGSTYSVKVKGLERSIVVDSNGFFTINNLPPSVYTLVVENSDSSIQSTVFDSITTESGKTTFIPEKTWNHHKSVTFTLPGSDSNHSEMLLGFPLLIRLTRDNFAFNQSTANGKDIWFMKADFKRIPFQIERWDSTAQEAEVWVGIDTISIDNKSTSCVMHWGDPKNIVKQVPSEVFSMSTNFQAVWHGNETVTEEAVDYTQNRYQGTRVYVTGVPGVIGYGQLFDGVQSFINIKNTASSVLNFKENSDFTITAWVKVDSLSKEHTIICKGPSQYALGISDSFWTFSQYRLTPTTGHTTVKAKAVTGEWVFLSGVCRNGSISIYSNGKVQDSSSAIAPSSLTRDETFDVNIGRVSARTTASKGFFAGIIDEITISSVARSDTWIKATYENQRTGSNSVKLEL